MRYVLRDPTAWAFDLSLHDVRHAVHDGGRLYPLARRPRTRADVIYRLWRLAKIQAAIELTLYILFFFPGILALVIAGWELRRKARCVLQ